MIKVVNEDLEDLSHRLENESSSVMLTKDRG